MWILLTGLAMNEFSKEQINLFPLVAPLPPARVAKVIAYIMKCLIDGPVKSLLDAAAVGGGAHRPQGRHVLRHAEAEVKRGPPVVSPVILGEWLPGFRMVAIKEALNLLLVHHPVKSKLKRGLIDMPHPGAFPAGDVVIAAGKLGVVPSAGRAHDADR